ncbi:UPF0175 family protein [Aquisphaera insulae]|uniref:UPF0175 family protein n=1 Tax=Aquisphaera insulae TaxID=2712864 RepID=UPI0013E9E88B
MSIRFDFPPEVESYLGDCDADLVRKACGAFLMQLQREGVITEDLVSKFLASKDLRVSVKARQVDEGDDTARGAASDQEIRETFALDLFRRGILDRHGLSRALGLDRFETFALLKRHQIFEGALTHADVEADVRSMDELLGPPPRKPISG